jgi:hypothetical protein
VPDIDIDDERIEKLPLWAGQLIYALAGKVESTRFYQLQAERVRDEAQNALHAYLNGTTGPADSDTFLERHQVDNSEADPTPALGLGPGAVVSFHAPALNRGDEAPSIQAQIRNGRLVLTTDFGTLALTIIEHTGRAAIAVTIADK